MSAVMTIAWRDFKATFATPKGAAIFFFFMALMALFFYSFIATFTDSQNQYGMGLSLEELLRAMFYNFHFLMILVVPAISMATFSEERKTQSLRLLFTAPVTPLQIVLGKFLATVAVVGLVIAASFAYPLYIITYGNPDVGVIMASYLGLFLLMCSQLAFGMWISSMTSNQFMAFLFTMLGLFLLMILNWLVPSMTEPGITADVVKYIASTDHLDVFLKGVISVRSTTYFLCMTALFLFFTNIVLDSQRWR